MGRAGALAFTFSLLLLPFSLSAPGAFAAGGAIVWDPAGSPYIVTGTYRTPAGSAFIIEDGTTVLMGPGASIEVAGPLEIRGGALGVVFKAQGAPAPRAWHGVHVFGGGTITGARFESGDHALVAYSPLSVGDSSFSGNAIGAYAQYGRLDLSRVTAAGNDVAFYWDHAPGSIADADISGGRWGVYLYAPGSDVAVTRVRVHDMLPDSYAVTTINNRPVIRESMLEARISVFLPACASDALVEDTWIGPVYSCYGNRIAVWNRVRAGTFTPAGAPVAGSDVRLSDLTGQRYASPGFGGSDPRTGSDGWGSRVLLLDWSWVPGTKTVNQAEVSIARGAHADSRNVDVSYRLDVPFEVAVNQPPVPIIDVHRRALLEATITGTPGNGADLAYEEDGAAEASGSLVRTAGPPDTLAFDLRVHDGAAHGLRLAHVANVKGANPVHLRIEGAGDHWSGNVNLLSKGGAAVEVVVDLEDALARALCGVREFTFDGSGSHDPDGSVVAYDWDFGDGAAGSGGVAVHTYSSPGVYTARLTVTDDGGEAASAEVQVPVGGGCR